MITNPACRPHATRSLLLERRCGALWWSLVCVFWAGGLGCTAALTPPPVTAADGGSGPVDAALSDASSADTSAPTDAGGGDAARADVAPDGVCASDRDCVASERCSSLGVCHEQECLTHDDCSATERCADRRCLPRPSSEHGFIFERYRPPAVDAHRSLMPSLDLTRQVDIYGDFGFGAALLDIDGDRDLDLFVGVQSAHLEGGTAPCLFENVSVGSTPAFRPSYFCDAPKQDWSGGYGFDVEGDGYHELVVTGDRLVQLIRFHPERRITDLLATLPDDNPRKDCNAGAAVNLDLNFDGRLDLVVACHYTDVDTQGRSVLHLAFVQTPDGGFEALTRANWNTQTDAPLLLEAQNSTIALGAADLNEDGLIDLMVSEDFYTRPEGVPQDPGGIYFRCAPEASCAFRPFRLGVAEREHGGLMGSGVVQVAGRGELAYFTDFGPNRMCQVSSERVRDFAMASGVELAEAEGGLPLFSWGVVVDDFNRDGLDDLLIAQGAIKAMPAYEYAMHFPALLRQDARGRFALHSDDVGLQPYSTEDSHLEEYPFAGRALLRADLDLDGFLDTIELGIEGAPRLHREVPQAGAQPRCSLAPRARYVPGFGVGFAFRSSPDEAWRKWDSQGQLKSGTTPFLVSPWQTGELRFPSGAIRPYTCGEPHEVLLIEEPAWLEHAVTDGELEVRILEGGLTGALSVYAEPSAERFDAVDEGDGRWSLRLPDATQRYMLRFGDRWLARWWTP